MGSCSLAQQMHVCRDGISSGVSCGREVYLHWFLLDFTVGPVRDSFETGEMNLQIKFAGLLCLADGPVTTNRRTHCYLIHLF